MTTATPELPAWIRAPAGGPTRTFWVSTTGNDWSGDGSFANPWRTINHAVNRPFLGGGDEIVVRPGTYTEQVWMHSRGGSSEGQLTLRSEVPGQALIRAPEGEYTAVSVRGVNHITIEGFDIVGGDGDGIIVRDAAHTAIRNNIVHDSGAGGIVFMSSEFILIEGNITFGNAITGTWHNSGISVYQNRNITGDTTTPGFRTIIRNNISHGNYTGPDVPGEHTDGNGIIIDDFQSTQTEGFPNYTFPTLVENNLAYNNGGKGIHVVWSDFVTVRNNTVAFNNFDLLNTGTWRGELSNHDSSNNIWVNNIAVADPSINPHNTAIGNYSWGGYLNQNVVWENNLTFNGTPGEPSLRITGGNSTPLAANGNLLGIDPMFANAAGADFSLLPGSPALDAGTARFGLPPIDFDGGTRTVGAVDIGAYERDAPAGSVEDPASAFRAYWEGLADAGSISAEHASRVLELFGESTGGTLQVSEGQIQGSMRMWLFENAHKSVLFLAAGATPPGDMAFDLGEIDPVTRALWSDGVDSGQTYAASPDPGGEGRGGEITLRFDTPFEFVRLAFAQTPQGEEEIATWSDAARIDLAGLLQETQPPDAGEQDFLEAPEDEARQGEENLPDSASEDRQEGMFDHLAELAAGVALVSLFFLFM